VPLKHKVIVCSDEWLSVFSDYVSRLGNEQEAKHKEVRQAFDARLTPEVRVMEVPHDESTSFGIEEEYDADWVRATFESQSSDRIAKSDVVDASYGEAVEGDRRFVCSQKERAEAQPRLARPPPWRDKCNRGSELFVACNSVQRHEATSQEGVKKYHLCFRLPINSLWEALEMKAWSPNKFMDVTSVMMTAEDIFLSRSMMIKAKNILMEERI